MSEETTVVEEKVEEKNQDTVQDQNSDSTPDPKTSTETDETKVEGTDDKKENQDKDQEQKDKPNRFQKRINQLTSKIKALESQIQMPRQQQAPIPKPERNQFNSDDQYIEAITDYKLNERLPQVQKQFENQSRSNSVNQSFTAKENQVRKEIEDYDDVIADSADIPVHKSVAEAILTSDIGPNLRYYLASHPDEAESLNNMSEATAARQIGRIEAKLEQELATKKNATPKKQSNAPAPVKPVRSSGPVGELDLNDSKVSIDDWMKKRREARTKAKTPLKRIT